MSAPRARRAPERQHLDDLAPAPMFRRPIGNSSVPACVETQRIRRTPLEENERRPSEAALNLQRDLLDAYVQSARVST